MGYCIKKLPNKKSDPKWKVQYVSFKKADAPNSKAKMPRRTWDVQKRRWQTLGFNEFMTVKEAAARAKQLNAQLCLKRQEERLRKIADEQYKTQKRQDSVLPVEFVLEFEQRFIREADSQTKNGSRKSSRSYTAWRAAQRMIVAIGVEPSDWFYHTHQIYDYFHQKRMSLRYLYSVLSFANLWGFFICRKLNRPFLPIPRPKGYERQRLIDANYEKRGALTRGSQPLLPCEIARIKGKINIKNFN